MTTETNSGPNRGRFRKGQSGNPSGRPKRAITATPVASAFEIVLDRTLTLTRDGEPIEVGVEEALWHKTYQDALAGKRLAIRQVLKWIEKRERWLAERRPRPQPRARFKGTTCEPGNADKALQLLGIASAYTGGDRRYQANPLLLEPWAVAAALRRPGGRKLTKSQIDLIKRQTRDVASIRLPEPIEP
jgi:hypothetical protein